MVSALRKPPLVRQVEDAACVCVHVCVHTEQVGESFVSFGDAWCCTGDIGGLIQACVWGPGVVE